MIHSPIKAIESGWITGNITEDCIQPNGIDFRLDRVFKPDTISTNMFVLTSDKKETINYTEMLPGIINTATISNKANELVVNGWRLNSGVCYDFMSDYVLNIPEDVACMLLQRSTLNRNQLRISSGLWDSGFKGNCGGQITNYHTMPAVLEKNVRIGQIIFMQAHAAKSYKGQYQSMTAHWSAA